MKIRPMKEIRQWANDTGRYIRKHEDTALFVLVTNENISRPLSRPRFRRAATIMIEIDIENKVWKAKETEQS